MVLEVLKELLCGHVCVECVRVFHFLVPCLIDDGDDEVDTASVGYIVDCSVGALSFMRQLRSLDDRFSVLASMVIL